MDSEDVVRRYYTRLFLLPKAYVLGIIYLTVTSVIAVADVLPSSSARDYIDALASYLKAFTLLLTLNVVLTRSKTLNLKRVLGLTTILIILFSIPEVVFHRLLGLKGLGILASTGLSLLVLPAFINAIRSITASVVPQLITYLIINNAFNDHLMSYLIKALAIQVTSAAASILTLTLIEFKGRSLLGIKPIRLLKSFLASWFSRDAEVLESEFMQYSEGSEVLIRLVLIRRDWDEDVLLVFPTLHYGPFRNVGSSRFIYHLEELLGSRYYVYVFHTPGSHERNLASSTYSEDIARYLNSNVDYLLRGLVEFNPCMPYTVVSNGWTAYVIPFPTGLIAFLSNTSQGADDLPYEVWGIIDGFKGTYVNAVVDTHSFKGPRQYDLSIFRELLSKVFSNLKCIEVTDFAVGHGESYVEGVCRGLCYNKVKALVMSFNGVKHALVYIYGNNMDGVFRGRLASEVMSLGINHVEIVTPDDHSCAASLKESPYDIISYCNSLIDAVKWAVNNALQNMSKAKMLTADVILTNVKLVGSKVWDMVKALEVLGQATYKYVATSIALMMLTPLTLLIPLIH